MQHQLNNLWISRRLNSEYMKNYVLHIVLVTFITTDYIIKDLHYIQSFECN